MSNPLVLEKVAKTGKPINLSVGASSISEIQFAVDTIQGLSQATITLMYGHQSFPTNPDNVHMRHMVKLKKKIHEQPEGIVFAQDGTLYISNEGKDGKAKIYKFAYQGQ